MLALGEAVLKKKRNRSYRASLESRAHGEREARRLLDQGLAAAGLKAQDLANIRGSDTRKVAIARVIRQRTTVRMNWIAEHLCMRSAGNVSQQLSRKPNPAHEVPKHLKEWILQS